jgi:hypothetical protein
MHQLIIEDDEGTRVVYRLLRDEISLGRDEGNIIRLAERHVSRFHARLMQRQGRYVLEDLASQLGTTVNGTRIHEPTVLTDGDQVIIGEYRLAYVDRPTTALGHPVVTAPPLVTSFLDKTPIPEESLIPLSRRDVATTSATPPPLPPPRRRSRIPDLGTYGTVAAVGVAVALTAGVTLWLTDDGHASRRTVATSASPHFFSAPAPETAAGLLLAAQRAQRDQHWADAMNLASRALSLDPSMSEADDLRRVIEIEQQNAAIYEIMRRDSERGDYAHLLDIAPTLRLPSAYGERAKALGDGARAKLIGRHLAAAERQRAAGDCTAARKQAQSALAVDPGNSTARTLIARCERSGDTRSAMAAGPRADAPAEAAPSEPGRTAPVEIITPAPADERIDTKNPFAEP